MRWSNAGSHEVVSMLGLSIRVGTSTERSPASFVPLSVTMDGLHVLQLVPKASASRRANLFMSQMSVNICAASGTTASMKGYDRQEGASMMSATSIPNWGVRRRAQMPATAARQTAAKGSDSSLGVCSGSLWLIGLVRLAR